MSDDAKGRYADEGAARAGRRGGSPKSTVSSSRPPSTVERTLWHPAAAALKEKLRAGRGPGRGAGAARNDDDASLLEKACSSNKVDAVRALLRVGAIPHASTPVAWLEEGSACRGCGARRAHAAGRVR